MLHRPARRRCLKVRSSDLGRLLALILARLAKGGGLVTERSEGHPAGVDENGERATVKRVEGKGETPPQAALTLKGTKSETAPSDRL